MSEKSWVLRGVDAEARQAALAEAERRGLSLSDYLTEVLLGEVLAEQAGEQPDVAPAPELQPESPFAPRTSRENFAFRHRVEALERRLTASLGGLDGALQALDSTVLSLTGQLDETGALAEDGAVALIELSANVAALRKRLADVEESAEALAESNDVAHDALAERCAGIEAHLTSVEAIAYAADAAGERLAQAQDALQRALAQDFNAFAHESDRRFIAATDDMRALAEDAAAHADAAAARAVDALRLTREAMEQQVVDQAAEMRAVVHGAFVDAAERIDALADRVLDNQRVSQRMGEQMNSRLNDVEDAALIAVEEATEALRQTDANLGAEINRLVEDARAAFAQVDARQSDIDQRLKLADFALNNSIADLAATREETHAVISDVEMVAATRSEALERAMSTRLLDIAERLDNVAEAATHDFQNAAANIDRVEACTFAALEKLARDLAAGDSAQNDRLGAAIARLDTAVTDAQTDHLGALARISVLDKALTVQDTALAAFSARIARVEQEVAETPLADEVNERLAQLEVAVADPRTEHALVALTEEVEALTARVTQTDARVAQNDPMAQLAELRAMVAAQETQINESADRSHGVARMLSRVAAQNADTTAQTEERLHKLELGLTDLRLDVTAATPDAAIEEAVVDIAERMAALERRQAEALDALHADIAQFIGENDRRLGALEQGGVATLSGDEVLIAHAIEARLTELEQRDVGATFDTLRQRIEERILGVEKSSVRALEQIAETVAIIEKRYLEDEDGLARSA